MNDLEQRLRCVEEKLEKPQKDGWDKFQVLATLLVPAAITFCGYLFSQAQKDIEIAAAALTQTNQAASAKELAALQIRSAEQMAEKQEIIARLNARVGQAEAVVSFIKSLLSPSAQERRLAIEAVLIALPDEGPRLVQIISVTDTDPEVKNFAAKAYEQRATALVEAVASADADQSDTAARNFAQGYGSDADQVRKLLEAAQAENVPTNAVHGTLHVLQAAPAQALRPNRAPVEQFVRKLGTNRPALRLPVQAIQRKL